MMNYVETASSSTIVPLVSVPSSKCQENITGCASSLPSSPTYSYVIGPIDPAQVHTLQARLTTSQDILLLVPSHLPHSLLTDPAFKDGYEWGYTETDPEEEGWTVPKLVNQVYSTLMYERSYASPPNDEEPAFYHWTLGFLLGSLAYLVEIDQTLALTGLAHYHFLLALLPVERTPPWPLYILFRARCLHNRTLEAYRARVRIYRGQGRSFPEAQRLLGASTP